MESIIHAVKSSSKVGIFYEGVLKPALGYLQESGSDAEVRLAGSYIHRRTEPRENSDIDFLLFSEELCDYDRYVDFCHFLNSRAQAIREEEKVCLSWFTSIRDEAFITEITKMSNCCCIERVLPVHFLFYPSRACFRKREQSALAERIIIDSKQIRSGRETSFIPNEVLDAYRWEAERILADYVLMKDLVSGDFLQEQYLLRINSLLRNLADEYLAPSEATVQRLLPILEEMGAVDLSKPFKVMTEARQKLRYDTVCAEAMMDAARKLFNI